MQETPENIRVKISSQSPDPYELVCGIYVLYKALRMNVLYYGKRLWWMQAWNLIYEILVALSTSATIAAVALFHPIVPLLAGIAAILSVTKPIIGVSNRVERLSKLWSDYTTTSLSALRIVNHIQTYHEVTPEMEKTIEAIKNHFDELSKRDDPYPSAKSLNKEVDAVDKELPAAKLWVPCGVSAA